MNTPRMRPRALIRTTAALACAAAIAGCSNTSKAPPATATSASSAPSTAGTFDVTGTLTLTTDVAMADTAVGPLCQGTNGFDDVALGESVAVLDASGTSVGLGKLQKPTANLSASPPSCTFGFRVFGVPAGQKSYSFRIGTRTAPDFGESEMREGPKLTLGT